MKYKMQFVVCLFFILIAQVAWGGKFSDEAPGKGQCSVQCRTNEDCGGGYCHSCDKGSCSPLYNGDEQLKCVCESNYKVWVDTDIIIDCDEECTPITEHVKGCYFDGQEPRDKKMCEKGLRCADTSDGVAEVDCCIGRDKGCGTNPCCDIPECPEGTHHDGGTDCEPNCVSDCVEGEVYCEGSCRRGAFECSTQECCNCLKNKANPDAFWTGNECCDIPDQSAECCKDAGGKYHSADKRCCMDPDDIVCCPLWNGKYIFWDGGGMCCITGDESFECCDKLNVGFWFKGKCCRSADSKECCDGVAWREKTKECCYSEQQSAGCCDELTDSNGSWLNGECCFEPYVTQNCCDAAKKTWVGGECCNNKEDSEACCEGMGSGLWAYDDDAGYHCCTSAEESEGCCRADGREWDGNHCCDKSNPDSDLCCVWSGGVDWIESSKTCCMSVQDAEECCPGYAWVESAPKGQQCCIDDDSKACCATAEREWVDDHCV